MFLPGYFVPSLVILLSASRTTSAQNACEDGLIALGTLFVHVTISDEAAIFNSSCSSIDFKAGGTDDDICGSYSGGASVACDASGVPQSGVLSDGTAFGNCVSNIHNCDNIKKVQYCCSPV